MIVCILIYFLVSFIILFNFSFLLSLIEIINLHFLFFVCLIFILNFIMLMINFIFTVQAITQCSAFHSCLKAFTIFFYTSLFLTITAFIMMTCHWIGIFFLFNFLKIKFKNKNKFIINKKFIMKNEKIYFFGKKITF